MSCSAIVSSVVAGSPAALNGIQPGWIIRSVEGAPLHDIIDWRWYASEAEVSISALTADGKPVDIVLERDYGQDWGIEFDQILFDGTRQCCNACCFCFMRQLPSDVRDSLVLRDDDFRLSFLQGTFVTLTNITHDDETRIIEQHISPLRFSLHAISPDLRTTIMGVHAQHGIDVAERLMQADIELHAQIVLMPGVNDGAELKKTLGWAYEHPRIVSVGIVPVGYTKHQTQFSKSFNDPSDAQRVVTLVTPFQERAMCERGYTWVYLSDEFYRNAYPNMLLEMLPPTEHYDDFSLFEDGIGIVRSFVDDFLACPHEQARAAQALSQAELSVLFVCGCAQKEFFGPLLSESPLASHLQPLFVQNDYFGGNIDVTGLLCACDIAPAIARAADDATNVCAVISSVVFNSDGLTLDDKTLADIQEKAGIPVYMVSCQASEFLPEITSIAKEWGAHG